MNGFNWLPRLMVFLFLTTGAVGSGWGSLLDFSTTRPVSAGDFQEFYEVSGNRSPCLWRFSTINAEPSVEDHSGRCSVPLAPRSSDEPQIPSENRFLISHHTGTGMTGRSIGGNGANGNVPGGILSGQVVWIAGTPVSDWLMSHIHLIWRSTPIRELLKVPIC